MIEPSPSGRSAGRGHHQPERPGDRHRPDLREGRQGHPQPDAGLRPGHGLRLHRDARQPLDHGPVAGVVARRRPAGATSSGARRARRIVIQNVLNKKIEKRIDLKTVDEPESPALLARRQVAWRSRPCRTAGRTSSRSTWPPRR
ncbi:MAG: hypothetical protein M0C28_16545 [Candidatus Moduliflexus flocculans]|nr:hypothetical protein [Candidatus Moduliflexus flocculans]